MPELKAVPGVAKVTAHGSFTGGSNTANIFHVDRAEFESGPWTLAELQTMVTAFRAAFVTRFLPYIVSIWTLGAVEAIDLTNDTGVVAVQAGTNAGARAGSAMPANVAQCVTWKIARHYRGGHPRTYLAPPDVGETQPPNAWKTAHVTNMQTAASGFVDDINSIMIGGDECRFTAIHRYRGYTVNPQNGKKTPIQLDTPLKSYITAAVFDSRVDSQRRRLGPDR